MLDHARPAGRLFRGMALALAGVTLVACSNSSTSSTSNATLVVDDTFVLQTSDPARTFDGDGAQIERACYDTLLTYKNGDLTKPVPDLASSYTASSDATTYTFKLRSNVKFSDGTPVTSTDVLFSFNRLANIKGNPSVLLDGMTFSAPDAFTFVITSAKPNPAIPAIITAPYMAILNSKVVKAHGGSDGPDAKTSDQAQSYLDANSAGSGPYVIVSEDKTTEVDLKANPNYWGSQPYFQKIVIRNQTAATQQISVAKGQDEIALNIPASQASSVGGNTAVSSFFVPYIWFLIFNDDPTISSTTSNQHIQQAARYALDYSGILNIVGGGAVQIGSAIPNGMLGALPQSSFVHQDLGKAQSELAASGISKPTLKMSYPNDLSLGGVNMVAVAQKIQSDLQAAGITVTLEGGPVATVVKDYLGGKESFGFWLFSPDYLDPEGFIGDFLPGTLVGKRAGWPAGSDSQLESLGSQVATTADPAQRASLFTQIQTRLNDVGPFVFMFQPKDAVVSSKNLTGVTYNPVWFLTFSEIGSS